MESLIVKLMVFQNPDHQILMPNCRSELLININQNISDYEITKKIEYVLDQVGLTGFEKRPIHTLSGGQKQRLTIASAFFWMSLQHYLIKPAN